MEKEQTIIETPEVSSPLVDTTGDLKSTVEMAMPDMTVPVEGGDDKTTEDTTVEGKEDQAQAEEKTSEPEEKLDRFDKHPRFQELRAKIEMLESKLSQEAEEIKAESAVKGPDSLFADLDDDGILDALNEKPKEFLGTLTEQIYAKVKADFETAQQQKSQEDSVLNTVTSYAKANPDFDKMWDSGELKAYMDKNPGHNAISAHQMMTAETKMQAAVEKARKEAKEETLKQIKAKQGARVLGSGPATSGSAGTKSIETIDTKQYGGDVSFLAARSAARRRSA